MRYTGTSRSDELLGHHGSDTLRGGDSSDVLWGDWNPKNQPEMQKDTIFGGNGTDFIYGCTEMTSLPAPLRPRAHRLRARGVTSTARSRRKGYRFRNCEKVDYRPEAVRGGPMKPLS